ncbi:helix-turn-helix domain-containing protein [bacterium]|nr:helix-turn-helix domain-containing protein [bacterium]
MAVRQPTIYTTGQVAKLCAVSIRTVARWIEMNHLKAFRLPGMGSEYRVLKKDLLRFMEEYHLPTDHIGADTGYRVLLIEGNDDIRQMVRETMKDQKLDYTLYEYSDFIEGLINIGLIKPHLVIFDYDANKAHSAKLYNYINTDPQMKNTRTLILTKGKAKDKEMAPMNKTGISFVLHKPLDPVELLKKSSRLMKKSRLK